jgi:hypothetical protein
MAEGILSPSDMVSALESTTWRFHGASAVFLSSFFEN